MDQDLETGQSYPTARRRQAAPDSTGFDPDTANTDPSLTPAAPGAKPTSWQSAPTTTGSPGAGASAGAGSASAAPATGGAGFGTTPPRPEGPSTASETGGTGESLPGGSGGATQKDKAPSIGGGPTAEFGGGGSGGGGIGADFGQIMNQIGPVIGDIGNAVGGFLGGGGLGGLASGLGGILGAALPKNDEDDTPLLGEQAITVGDVPTGFAGTGPDHQHWATSSEDYVDAHERRHHQDIDDFDGDILKYSGGPGQFEAALRQANAFDNYADWGFAATDSADPRDWGSVDEFISDAEERQGYLGLTEPAKTDIKEHLHYTKAGAFAAHLAASNAGYFGVGGAPGLPTTDGLSHTNGAANLKGVTKPKKVKPPRAPKLPAPIPHVQPQSQQQNLVPAFSEPPPMSAADGAPAMAQPRTSMLAGPGQVAPAVTSERPGGIQRQAAQVGAGALAPVFGGEFTAPPTPDYGAYEPAAPVQVVDYNPYRTAAPGPIHTSPWDDVAYLPGQDPVAPAPVARTRTPMTMQARLVDHDPTAASLMGEYRDPNPASYGRTDDSSAVVRQFQAAMGGGDWATDYQPTGVGNYDVAAGAHQFLSRTAGRVFSQAEQARLEQESHVLGARNLDELDLSGTHYLEG